MRNGNISNKGGIKLAFRVEDTLIRSKKHNTWVDGLACKFNPLYHYEINTSAVNILRTLYVTTDYNLVLVVSNEHKNNRDIKNLLERLNYCSVEYVDSNRASDIATYLLTKEWEYYVDDCYERRAKITMSPEYAVSLTDFAKLLQKL